MPTTKKVAPVRAARAKKGAASKKTSRTSSSKSLLRGKKQSTATVAKLAIKDNSTRKAKSPDFEEKLQNFGTRSAQKRSLPPKVRKTPFSLASGLSKTKQATALALLSPYRFPVDAEKLATATARYSGIFFVVIGACFTLLYADATLNKNALQATVLTTQGALGSLTSDPQRKNSGENVEEPIDCLNKSNFLNTLCAAIVDQKPSAELVTPDGILSSSTHLKIKVPFADMVTVMAYNRTQKRELTLGNATRVSDDTWEKYWSTTQYDDGDYKLKLLIKNGYGSYEIVDDAYVTVANAKLEDAARGAVEAINEEVLDDALDDAQSTTSTESVPSDVSLTITKGSEAKEFRMDIKVLGADKVKIYATRKLAANRTLLGYAYKEDDGLWKYRWAPNAQVPPGEYEVIAYALLNGREIGSNTLQVAIPEADSSVEAESVQPPVSTTSVQKIMAPKISLSLDPYSVSKEKTIKVSVEGAESVELFLKPSNALTQKYLGRAVRVDANVWLFTWDTSKTPNGAYSIFAYVKNKYGTYNAQSPIVTVANTVVPALTQTQQKSVELLRTVEPIITNATATLPINAEGNDEAANITDAVLGQFSEEIDKDLQRFATALRSNDPDAITRSNQRFEELKLQVQDSIGDSYDDEAVIGLLEAHLSAAIERTKEDARKIEKVIVERTAGEITKDSDADGVSDYDEVAIYSTDPFSADSDQDGFTDGAEILGGFDPTDPVAEASVAFESPKERGIVREDILKVEAVIAAQSNDGQDDGQVPAAILSGKGLPNSFVTLYVFSTPVVVTVKTDEEGNWTYRFDKELEDGEHEVYVGVTDNAGRLVAKSAPFSFVKEAQAFSASASTQAPPPAIVVDRSMASQKMIYLVLSISVVAIGLVLIMLGLYLERRQRFAGLTQAEAVV